MSVTQIRPSVTDGRDELVTEGRDTSRAHAPRSEGMSRCHGRDASDRDVTDSGVTLPGPSFASDTASPGGRDRTPHGDSVTPCTACAAWVAWVADPASGRADASCEDCTARALAQSPAAWRALHAETATDLQDAILTAFGAGEGYERGRRLVWEWIGRMKDAQAAASRVRASLGGEATA